MRLHSLVWFVLVGSAPAIVRVAAAQEGARVVAVDGIAYDSLRARPLAGALLTISGAAVSAISDDSGHFRLEGIRPGPHELLLQHDALDSLGIAAVRRTIVAGDARDRVVIAIPPFDTFWHRSCGALPVPRDSGVVFGTVRDARSAAPVAGATLRVRWTDLGFDRESGVGQTRMGGTVTADAEGRYAACGVPTGTTLELLAGADGFTPVVIAIPHLAPGVTRQELFVRARSDSLERGTVRGIVHAEGGQPAADVRVALVGGAEVVSGGDGRFRLTGVPIGTAQLDVRAIGATSFLAVVQVAPDDTAEVSLRLHRLTELEPVRVAATSLVVQRFVRDLEERRALGIAKFVDSTAVERRGTIVGALTNAANLWVNKSGEIFLGMANGRPCRPTVFIDRREVSPGDVQAALRMINVTEIGSIEIYPRKTGIPPEFWGKGGLPSCVIVIWTKRMFP